MARISFNRRNLRNILVLASFASFLLIFLYLAFSEHEDYSSTSTRNPHLDVAVDITNTSNSGSMKLGRYSSRKRRIITIDISQPPPLPAHYLQEAMEERSEVSKFCFAFMTGQQVALGFPAIPYCGPGRKEIATGLGFSESLSFHDKMVRMALIEKGDARLRVAQNKAKAGRKRIEKQLELMAESYGESDDVDEGAEGEPAFDGNQKNRRSLDEASLPEDTASQYPFDPLNQKTGVYSNPDQVVQSPGEAVKLDYVNGTSETPAEPVEGGASRISCKTIDAHIPHTVCDTTNVAISASLLKQSHSKQAQPKFGTVKASCELNETLWFKPHVFGSGAVNWFRGGVDMMDLNKDGIHCDAWVNTPIFAIKRWDTIDPFNIHQDLLNTFIAYASMDIDPSKYQVIVLDDRSPDGPFVSAYTDIFSTSSEFLDMKEITSLSAEGSTVCFKRIVWGFSGQISALSLENSRETRCKQSPLLLAFRRFMLDRWRRTVLGPKGIDPGSIPVDTKVSGLPVMPVPKSYFLDLNVESREVAKQQKAEEEGHDTPDNQQQPVDDHVPNRLARRSGGRPDLEMKFIDDDDQFEDLKVSPIVITYAIRKAYSMSEPLYEEDDAEHHDRTDERDSPEALESPSPSINTTLHRRSASAPHPASRGSTIKNERELIERIRRAVSFWSTPESGRRANVNIRFRAVDFATLAVEDQVALAQDTDVLIGAHGGVLVNLIYLRAEPVGGLLELKPARIKNKRLQYRNLAYQLGFRYDAVSIGQSYVHNLDLVVRRLRQLVVEVYRIRRNGMLANQASLTYTPPESDEKAW